MLLIEGNITHQSRNSPLMLNLGRKSAIKSVSQYKQKIPHLEAMQIFSGTKYSIGDNDFLKSGA